MMTSARQFHALAQQGIKLNVFPITDYGVADYYTPNIIASPNTIKQKADLLHRFMKATEQGYEKIELNLVGM